MYESKVTIWVDIPIIVSWSKMKANNANFTFFPWLPVIRSMLWLWISPVWQKYSLLGSANRTRFSNTPWLQFDLALHAQETHVAPAGLCSCVVSHMDLAYAAQHGRPQSSHTTHKRATSWVNAVWKQSCVKAEEFSNRLGQWFFHWRFTFESSVKLETITPV